MSYPEHWRFLLARRGGRLIRCRSATEGQQPAWTALLDHSGICASIKGGAILEQMVVRKTVCLRRLGGSRRGELQAGYFFANQKVTAAKIVESWSNLTGPACAGRWWSFVMARSRSAGRKTKITACRHRLRCAAAS